MEIKEFLIRTSSDQLSNYLLLLLLLLLLLFKFKSFSACTLRALSTLLVYNPHFYAFLVFHGLNVERVTRVF